MNELEWYVYRVDFNTKQIYHFNIFNHYRFFQDCCDNYKRNKKDIPKFLEEMKRDLKYYMWSRYEYEVLISQLFSSTQTVIEEKVDAFEQVFMNWKAFETYILNNLDKFKIKKEKKSYEV